MADPSSSEDEQDKHPSQSRILQQKRRAQDAIFSKWLASPETQTVFEEKRKSRKLGRDADEDVSIHSLLAQQHEGEPIVHNPREYQLELFERAKQENTIAVLDTGSGKTLIAVLLLRWMIDQELTAREGGQSPRVSFFLVASVTLVYQQCSVLKANLDHNVARLSGADNTDNWNKSHWQNILQQNKIIVCTADILLHALGYSYVTMKQINLLVFDEAHHAKKNHAYARIIKEYYIPEPEHNLRPRVFGMTASPIDARADIERAAIDLESLLDSKIATAMHKSLAETIRKPREQVLPYPQLPLRGSESAFMKNMMAVFGELPVLKRAMEQAPDVARHLGRWCADRYLVDALSSDRQVRYERRIEKKCYAQSGNLALVELEQDVAVVKDAVEIAHEYRHKLDDPISDADVSSKVLPLRDELALRFERPTDDRCIVFVNRRETARLLCLLFQRISTEHMRPGYLTGSSRNQNDEDSLSYREQVLTLLKFRKGEINCLFATNVAEEGLDVPDCNLVVRFDLYNTMIQYVQSRGRARKRNSLFIHMVEANNSIQRNLMSEVRYQEMSMRRFCTSLPADRQLGHSVEELMEREKTLRTYTIPSTGAKLTYGNALTVLAIFVAAIPTESKEPQYPVYSPSSRGQKFICEVILPANAPITSATGVLSSKKSLARRSAAFEACLELRKRNYLDENLQPVYQKRLPAMRNAHIAVSTTAKNLYPMQVKPEIWAQGRGVIPTELCMIAIDFPEGLERRHQPLILLTRTPLCQVPAFSVYLNSGRATLVSSTSFEHKCNVDSVALDKLTTFTLRMFSDVFSKKYEHEPAELSYWLAPAVRKTFDSGFGETTRYELDFDLLDLTHAQTEYKWTPDTPPTHLIDKFLVDRWDGSRKFFSKSINLDLKQTDAVPSDAAKGRWGPDIANYSLSLYKNARIRYTATSNQPVIEAEKILLRRNMLAPPQSKEISLRTKAYLIPEPLRISMIPPPVAASCLLWPAIIHRFESCLISIEACATVGLCCSPDMASAAFTMDIGNNEDSQDQSSAEYDSKGDNYERLEFIGDTFLKTATSISTFILNPNENEFEFHVRRMLMLCNKNLFDSALVLGLPPYIRSMSFSRRLWYPEGLKLLEGKGSKRQEGSNDFERFYHEIQNRPLNDKVIADVCEALIGATFMTHHKLNMWHATMWDEAVAMVTKLVRSDDHQMLKWSDYAASYEVPAYQTEAATAPQRDLVEKVATKDAYRFKHPRLLYSAFLHPSCPLVHERVPNYQRLEFLGDALLDQASITWLFNSFPDKNPQWLTEHKMAMVSNKFLGVLCVVLGFHKHLRHQYAKLQSDIANYILELEEAREMAGAESRDFWTTLSEPPKCLPDIVESYIGAMFIDSGFNFAEVERFFVTHVHWFFEDMSLYHDFANRHPCTRLHQVMQTNFGCTDYRLMSKVVSVADNGERTITHDREVVVDNDLNEPDVVDKMLEQTEADVPSQAERKEIIAVVIVHDQVLAFSAGSSGRYTQLRAAKEALDLLEGLIPAEFRQKFACDCRPKGEEADGDQITSVDHHDSRDTL